MLIGAQFEPLIISSNISATCNNDIPSILHIHLDDPKNENLLEPYTEKQLEAMQNDYCIRLDREVLFP